MNSTFKILAGISLASALAFAQPSITEVSNAASYDADLARGVIFIVKGRNLGPQQLTQSSGLPLQTELAGTRVRVGNVDAFMVYSWTDQIAAILPSTTPLGTANVTVTYNGQTSAPKSTTVIESEFGIFTQNSGGYGPGAIQNFVSQSVVVLNNLTNSANSGQTLILYGTGLGPIDTADNAAPGLKAARVPVELIVGDRTVQPVYAGRSPNFPGLDQINFVLPAEVAEGCYVTVQVRANNRLSNAATIAKANSGTVCKHPLGLTEQQMRTVDAGGKVTMGFINLSKTGLGSLGSTEFASAMFSEIDISGLYAQSSSLEALGASVRTSGACTVVTFRGTDSGPGLPTTLPAARALNAGNSLTIRSGSVQRDMPRVTDGSYLATLASPNPLGGSTASVLTPGTWTVSGAGGSDIGPFSAAVTIGEPLVWTNKVTSVPRNQPLTVNWTGGGAANNLVLIGGSSFRFDISNPQSIEISTFSCQARAGDRTLTVPSNIVSALPASDNGSISLMSGSFTVDGVGPKLNIPLTRGGNLDIASITYLVIDSNTVAFR